MSHSPLQPPVPFSDFEFTFDPSLSNLFPNPPPLPSSADLFSPSETTDLLGFLDNFNDFEWDLNPNNNSNEYVQEPLTYDHVPTNIAPYSNPHLNTVPDPSTSTRPKPSSRQALTRGSQTSTSHDDRNLDFDPRNLNRSHSIASDASTVTFTTSTTESPTPPAGTRPVPPRSKPLLSTPQKRLNHIMSEQKRRNAIRDGYAQLIALLAPAGSAPGIAMPTRGRPKGSGSRGKGQSKGKSGVLFRAVEYCRWLEEGRDTLREEVLRVEAAAGIRHP
ncbi:hypothetical protein BJ165DRAFT_1521958 [Panaeolus papilionaceus]|nr:hypothetical protein BJ165DRAFT_1521958 [Panaeolus papilionaceus]